MAIVTGSELEYVLSWKRENINRQMIIDTFAKKMIKKPNGKMEFKARFKGSDKMTVPKGVYHNNPSPIATTVGKYFFNVFFISPHFYDIFGYINVPIDADKFEDIERVLSKQLLDDKIETEHFIQYLNDVQWFGFSFNNIFVSSMSKRTTIPLDAVAKEKSRLIKQHSEELQKGNAEVAAKIEKELLSVAKKELGKDTGMELYDSGAKPKFGNNYKNLFVMKGPMQDNTNGGYKISTSNYIDGIEKDDIELYADALVTGAYAKGVGTQVGGYLTKKYMAAFQSLVLGDKGTDCKAKNYQEIFLTKKNAFLFEYRYIIEGTKLVLLDDTTMPKYIGRKVKMRDPLFCASDKICNKCAGELYYKLGIPNIGITSTRMSASLMQRSLKKFHDTSIKLNKIDITDLVID